MKRIVMFYVYVLKSKQDDNLYIGYTKNLKERIDDHNHGLVPSTKPRRPLALVYYEAYLSESDARHREKMLKKFGGSMTHLRNRIKHSLFLVNSFHVRGR